MPFLPQVFARQGGSAPPASGGSPPQPPSGPPPGWGPPAGWGLPSAAGPPPGAGPPVPAGDGSQQKPPGPPQQQQQQHCWKDPKTGSQVCVWEQNGAKNETKVHDEGNVHDYHESHSSKENDAIVGKVPGTDPAVFLPPGFRPSRASTSALESAQTTSPAGVSSEISATSSSPSVGSPYASTSAPQSAQATYPAGVSSGQSTESPVASTSAPQSAQTTYPAGASSDDTGSWSGQSQQGKAAGSSSVSEPARSREMRPLLLPTLRPAVPPSPSQPTGSTVEPNTNSQQWSGTMQSPTDDDNATTVFEGKKSGHESGSHDVHSAPNDFSDHSDSHDKEDKVWKAHTGYANGAGSDMDIHRSSDENKETLHQDKNGTHNLYQTEDDRDSNHIAWSSHPGYGWQPGRGGEEGPKGLEIQQEEEKHAAEEEHSGKGYYDFQSQSETVGSTSVQVGGEDAWEDADAAFAGMRGLIPRSGEAEVVVVVVPGAVEGGEGGKGEKGDALAITKPTAQVVAVEPQQNGEVQLPLLNHTNHTNHTPKGISASDGNAFPLPTLLFLGLLFVVWLIGLLVSGLRLEASKQRAERQRSDALEKGKGSGKEVDL
ncbi:hypothetical protein KC346_g14301 [Hortaea werneckii]|nr:hypothetical protein KC346_g14301 [Hortaea werneckii]KAI7686857.1 hypothetical protein KC322_g12607 [Hortaea werneckii]